MPGMANDATRQPPRSHAIRLAVVLVLGVAVLAFLGIQVKISGELGFGNACTLTPPGYFDQELISTERHLMSYECVLDPHNGEPRYTIHRPWQSVRGY